MILRRPPSFLGICVSLAALCFVAAYPDQEYTISITDQSPTILYTPNYYGNGTNSWNVSYSLSPWSSISPSNANIGQGTSTHWTNATNATIQFELVGTGFTAYGKLSGQASIDLTIDGTEIPVQAPTADFSPPMLASASALSYGSHTIVLQMTGNGGVEFTGVDIVLASGADGATYTNVTLPAITSNQSLNSAFTFMQGGWEVLRQAGTTNESDSFAACTSDNNAQFGFTAPSNTSILIIYGDVGPTTADYSVGLSPDLYAGPSNQSTPDFRELYPLTPWATNNQVLYFASIIPVRNYAVTVQLQGPNYSQGKTGSPGTFAFTSVVCISSSTDGGSMTPSDAASGTTNYAPSIFGGVLGGVSGILLIIIVYWIIKRVRRKRRARRALNEVMLEDGDKHFELDSHAETTDDGSHEIRPFSAADSGHLEIDSNPSVPPGSPECPVLTGGNAKPSMIDFGPAGAYTSAGASTSTSAPTVPSPIRITSPSVAGDSANKTFGLDTHQEQHYMDGLDPSDPAYMRKWEILRTLDPEASPSTLSSTPSASSPMRTMSGRSRDVDAGRLEGAEDMLPPDYNPAWAPSRH